MQYVISTLKPRFLVLENVPVCCFQTMAATSKQSLKRLPNAGMWDFGACWTAVISGPTKRRRVFMVAGLESCAGDMGDAGPMARLSWPDGAGRWWTLNLRCLQVSPTGQVSTSRVEISSLLPTHGIRWLSGRERLSIMGFAADWMRPTLARLSCRKRRLSAGRTMDSQKLITTFQAV